MGVDSTEAPTSTDLIVYIHARLLDHLNNTHFIYIYIIKTIELLPWCYHARFDLKTRL